MSLRQLYYQFVSRDLLPNQLKSYKRLGGIMSNTRDAGLVDWDSIEDRTRELVVMGQPGGDHRRRRQPVPRGHLGQPDLAARGLDREGGAARRGGADLR